MMTSEWTDEIKQGLAEPFDADSIEWKPQITKKKDGSPIMQGGQQVAGCMAYIDARDVLDRLDSVVGPENWTDEYMLLPGSKNVECTLTVLGVSKTDVGQINDGGFADPIKSAYSDALKRAAVKFGIGRHLYDLEMEWLPYDGFRVLGKPDEKDRVTHKPPAPTSASASNGKKLMSREKYLDYIASHLGYNHTEHVLSTMRLLGWKAVPNDSEKRKQIYDTLEAYRGLRDKGMSQDDALAALAE